MSHNAVMPKYEDGDDYMTGLPDDRRAAMEQLRSTIRAAAPDAIEAISYNMPSFRQDGRFLVSYEAFKAHYSLFPWNDEMVEELGEELKPYAVGKGTIRFPADQPIPVDLVTRLIEIRNRQHAQESDARKAP